MKRTLLIGTILYIPFIALSSWADSPFSKFTGTYTVEKCSHNSFNQEESIKMTLDEVDTITDGKPSDSHIEINFFAQAGGKEFVSNSFNVQLMGYTIPSRNPCLNGYQYSVSHEITAVVTGTSNTALAKASISSVSYHCTDDKPQTSLQTASLSVKDLQDHISLKFEIGGPGVQNPEVMECVLHKE